MKKGFVVGILKNRKAVSLTELMVAMAILAIIVSPFIATTINSANNNQYAEEKMNTSTAVQNFTEEVKARSLQWLESEVAYFAKGASDNYKISEKYSNERITVKYRIEKLSEGILSSGTNGGENIYSSFTNKDYSTIKYDIEFYLKTNQIVVDKSMYSLKNPYYLEINEQVGICKYNLKDLNKSELKSGTLTGESINILIQADEVPDNDFELYNYISDTAKEVKYHIIGKNERIRLINDGGKSFYRYNNLSKDYIVKYTDNLYKIDVKVEADNEDAGGMISYVKK